MNIYLLNEAKGAPTKSGPHGLMKRYLPFCYVQWNGFLSRKEKFLNCLSAASFEKYMQWSITKMVSMNLTEWKF
jgi:hypothetical protein